MADPLPFVPNTLDHPDELPPDAHAATTSEYLFGGPVVNKSTDFPYIRPRPDLDLPPPAPPPSLPPMGQGELRDMLHAATIHILDLERRMNALEGK